MKKFRQIRTKEVIRWLSPENRMVTLHKIAYQGLHYCGYVESWDNIDKKSVLIGIAYGNSKITDSKVIGVIGHGTTIEGSYVHFNDGFCISELADRYSQLYTGKYYDVQHVNIECTHVKNSVMRTSAMRYHVRFAPAEWDVLNEGELEYLEDKGLSNMYTTKQMWMAPDFYGLAETEGTALPNIPITLIHNLFSDVENKYYTFSTDLATAVGDYFGDTDHTKMFADDYFNYFPY